MDTLDEMADKEKFFRVNYRIICFEYNVMLQNLNRENALAKLHTSDKMVIMIVFTKFGGGIDLIWIVYSAYASFHFFQKVRNLYLEKITKLLVKTLQNSQFRLVFLCLFHCLAKTEHILRTVIGGKT